jgi:hypothetical protein
MRPVCVGCSTELIPVRNGVSVSYEHEHSTEYRAGDKFECPCCETQIVVGLATKPTDTPHGEITATIDRR